MNLDVLIKNPLVYDGLGNDPVPGDVGIANGRIIYPVTDTGGLLPGRVIDARGLALSPGFINIHSHSGTSLLLDGRAPSTICQGITTEVIGNCGFSLAPLMGEQKEEVTRDLMRDYGLTPDWVDFEGLFHRMERQGIAPNVISLVGHGTLRGSVMGLSDRRPRQDEMDRMKLELEMAMARGARGLSTGLIYPPGVYSETGEIVQLASVVARHGGFYSSHIRSESDGLMEAIDEALDIGRLSGVPVEISHIKSAGEKNWGRVSNALRRIGEARNQGQWVQQDQYPYPASSTGLQMILPDWAHDGGSRELVRRLRDPQIRQKIRQELVELEYSNGRIVLVSQVNREENKKFQGHRIDEIARDMGIQPVDLILNLIASEDGSVGVIFFSMCPEDVKMAMKDPHTSICTDASARAVDGILHRGMPHPRAYGAFPRVLGKYVREEKVLSLPDAIRKMTSLPARMLRLWDRGVVAHGFAGDLVIFDPDRIRDTATYQDPHSYPVGIRWIIVNGHIAVEDGEISRCLRGRVLGRPLKDLAKIV